ncbi:MAG: hypothetical protein QM796_18670 [Chthoniobacteraceae bacterium]
MSFSSPIPDPFVWRGPTDLKYKPAKWSIGVDRVTCTLPVEGPYSSMLANRPAIGQVVSGLSDFGVRVTRIEIDQLEESPAGKMTITLEAAVTPDPSYALIVEPPRYEVEFGELQKKIEYHPKCGTLTNTGVSKGGWESWSQLVSADYQPSSAANAWSFETYLAMKKAGVDTYAIGAPIVRRTIRYFANPGGIGQNCYKRQQPPVDVEAPTGYQWLIGTDRLSRSGSKMERVQEWIGYDERQDASGAYVTDHLYDTP